LRIRRAASRVSSSVESSSSSSAYPRIECNDDRNSWERCDAAAAGKIAGDVPSRAESTLRGVGFVSLDTSTSRIPTSLRHRLLRPVVAIDDAE
jgi:hypothetical protein